MLLALLGAGCEVDATDRYGDTPTHLRCKRRPHGTAFRLLLQNVAPMEWEDRTHTMLQKQATRRRYGHCSMQGVASM